MIRFIAAFLLAGLAYAGTPVFPNRLAKDSDLLVARNRAVAALTGSLTSSATSFTVADASLFTSNMVVTIDDEVIRCTTLTSNTFSGCTRGFDSTAAASHIVGATVSAYVTAIHHNQVKDEIIELEKKSADARAYNFAAQTPGGTLTAGVGASVTLSPCPDGVSPSDVGHNLYISNGTGTPEAVLVLGGSTSSTGCTVIVTPANSHSGAWTVSSATGGMQEQICALPSAGGVVETGNTSLTLRANVGSCGKTSVVVEKTAGATLSGSFTVLGKSSHGTYFERFGSDMAVVIPSGSFAFGSKNPSPSYLFHVEGGQVQPSYPAFDPIMVIGRADNSNPGGAGYARTALSIYHQVDYVAGTPWGMISILDQSGIDSAQTGGTAAIYGRVVKHTSSNAWATGVHGEVFADGAGTSIGINSEVTKTASGTGSIIGIVAHLTPASIGTEHTGIAIEGIVNYPTGGTNSGGGQYLVAGAGTSTYGLKIEEAGGTFLNPLQVFTLQSTPTNPQVQISSYASGSNKSAARLGFYRGNSQVGEIRGDQTADGNFGEGEVSIWTESGGALAQSVSFANVGGFTFKKTIPAASLAISGLGNGSMVYCPDCTSVCGGGGTGAIAKKLNGSWVCN